MTLISKDDILDPVTLAFYPSSPLVSAGMMLRWVDKDKDKDYGGPNL